MTNIELYGREVIPRVQELMKEMADRSRLVANGESNWDQAG